LFFELITYGFKVEKQKALPLKYKNVFVDCGYRLDLIVEEKVIVEVKTVEALSKLHLAQVLTYLKLTKCKLGLLINFNTIQIKDGIKKSSQWIIDLSALCALCGYKDLIYGITRRYTKQKNHKLQVC